MHPLVCIMFVCVVTLDYARSEFGLPQALALVPELLSGVALLFVLSGAIANGMKLRAVYVLAAAIFVLIVLAGLVIADATTGPFVGGIRFYGKYIPFLLLPIACEFTEAQLRFQMKLLLGLALIQMPITFLQRFVIYAGGSGDLARGTFTSGSQNAIVLLSVIAVVTGFYHKRLIGGVLTCVLGVVLFLPSTVAEVKGAFILMPLAMLIPALLSTDARAKSGMMLRASFAVVLALGMYAVAYNLAESTRDSPRAEGHRTSILEFVTDPRKLALYLAPQLAGGANPNREGRIDGVVEPLIVHKDDVFKLATGLGLGALSKSPFAALSADQHAYILSSGRPLVTMSYLLWEIGILGTLVVCIGLLLLWLDARQLSRHGGPLGALALGWLAVVPIFFLAMFWKNTLINNAVMFLFAYFSGHVIAEAYRLRYALVAPGQQAASAVESDATPALPQLLNEVGRRNQTSN